MLGKALRVAVIFSLVAFAVAQNIPTGTHITVRIGSEISSGTAKTGERFDGTLASDLVVHGKTLARAGAPVRGKVTSAKSSGRLHAPGQLSLRLTGVDMNGKMVPVSTSSFHVEGKSHTKSNATKIGGGAAAGALIGALAGGGKGAAIGAVVGGGTGTGVAVATGKQEAIVAPEQAVTFTVTSGSASRPH